MVRNRVIVINSGEREIESKSDTLRAFEKPIEWGDGNGQAQWVLDKCQSVWVFPNQISKLNLSLSQF